MGLLQESVGLVRVGEVGRSANHVLHLSSKHTEHVGRGVTCGVIGFLLDGIPVDGGYLAGKPLCHLHCEVGVLGCPDSLGCILLGNNLLKFSGTLVVESLHFGEYLEGILEVATEILDGVHISIASERCAVCSAAVLIACAIGSTRTFTHESFTDNQCRTFLLSLSLGEGSTYLIGIITVDGDDFPVPCLILLGNIFTRHLITCGRKLYFV